jgi:hypothetical protein
MLGRNAEALLDYTQANGLDPKNPTAYTYRAIVYEKLQQPDLAQADARRADAFRQPEVHAAFDEQSDQAPGPPMDDVISDRQDYGAASSFVDEMKGNIGCLSGIVIFMVAAVLFGRGFLGLGLEDLLLLTSLMLAVSLLLAKALAHVVGDAWRQRNMMARRLGTRWFDRTKESGRN